MLAGWLTEKSAGLQGGNPSHLLFVIRSKVDDGLQRSFPDPHNDDFPANLKIRMEREMTVALKEDSKPISSKKDVAVVNVRLRSGPVHEVMFDQR
jgi:hypothetical protein